MIKFNFEKLNLDLSKIKDTHTKNCIQLVHVRKSRINWTNPMDYGTCLDLWPEDEKL